MSDNAIIHRESFYMLCEKQIGYGMSRAVWTSELFPDCVVKIEDSTKNFQNVIEWETWQRVRDTPCAKWFAPCKWISYNGSILVMKRTVAAQDKEYPDKMPIFLCDFKKSNYGLLNGQFVCHDYGTNLLFEYGMTKRLRKVPEWYNE